jgi:hypothetical protein
VHADEKQTAFVEVESAVCSGPSFAELKQRSVINNRARAADPEADLSRFISRSAAEVGVAAFGFTTP